MKTKLLLGIVFAVMLTVLGAALAMRSAPQPLAAQLQTQPQTPIQTQPDPAQQQPAAPAPTPSSGYTMAQVAQHAGAQSCWSAINGNVYDLTAWIGQHPGGPERILSICGADGSAAFNAQHGGARRPEQELQRFYIGALAQ